MQALTDAIVYLEDYPYESADAVRVAHHRAHVVARRVRGVRRRRACPTPAQVDARINADIKALAALQNDDGGFSTWTTRRRSAAVHQRPGHRSARARATRRIRGVRRRTRPGARVHARHRVEVPRATGIRRRVTRRARTRSTCATSPAIVTRRKAEALYRSDPELAARRARVAVADRRRPGDQAARSRGRSPTAPTTRRRGDVHRRRTTTARISCSVRIAAPTASSSTR